MDSSIRVAADILIAAVAATENRITAIDEKQAKELAKALESNASLAVSGMYRLGDIRHNTADLSKITALGFAPKVTLAAGIARFAAWARAIGPVENGFAQSLIESQTRGVLK